MGHKALDRLCARLIEHGLPATLPAALIENGTLPEQREVRATLAHAGGCRRRVRACAAGRRW